MDAVRVQLDGISTSFRYPHFLVGRQPTYRMPPPATIYGHICSAVGEFVEPRGLRFAYHFTFQATADDVEFLHIANVGTGRPARQWSYPENLAAQPNPVRRETLLFPSLVLYLAAPERQLEMLYHAFREPRYTVALGRSQDLAAYRRIDWITLQEAPSAYFEHTLLPLAYRERTTAGVTVVMPRYINPHNREEVSWRMYLLLDRRVRLLPSSADEPPSASVMTPRTPDEMVWIDPQSPEDRGLYRAVVWHSFVDDE
jgi:CRISPR-associated protein Cas5t